MNFANQHFAQDIYDFLVYCAPTHGSDYPCEKWTLLIPFHKIAVTIYIPLAR